MNALKERPILFSGPMVLAILDGHKTQTRRVVKPQPPADHPFPQPCVNDGYWWNDSKDDHDDVSFWPTYSTCLPCPCGKPGDRLWVRETWCNYPMAGHDGAAGLCYRATNGSVPPGSWKPSIHMPRWASRITLEITGVRVERLNEISRGDAMAEGCPHSNLAYGQNPCDWFHELWESINGPESWAANPWVWAIEFRKVEVAK